MASDNRALTAVVWCAVSDPKQAQEGKESLPHQEAEGLATAARLGLDVAAVLKVPGFSRDYIDIHECAAAMMAENPPITAMSDLLRLMKSGGFDVLICRDADRFGRTQSLISYIVEYIVKIMNARIYATSRGLWVDKSNFRMWAAMSGFQAAGELDTFRARRAIGMQGRFKRALPAARVPLSHTYERDDKGKPLNLITDATKARLLADLATLLLDEHLAYDRLARVLYEQYGHVNPDRKGGSKPYGDQTFRKLLYNPWFWGHSAQFINSHYIGGNQHTGSDGRWAYDPAISPPDGIEIAYNTHPAAYSGALADQIRAEIRRREAIRGTARPNSRYAYSSLLRCGICGFGVSGGTRIYTKRHNVIGRQIYYRCTTAARARRSVLPILACPGIGCVPEAVLDNAVKEFLTVALGDARIMLHGQARSAAAQIDRLTAEIATLETQLLAMIEEQSARKGSARALYTSKIDEMGDRLDILKTVLDRDRDIQRGEQSLSVARNTALEEVRGLTIEAFMVLCKTDKARFNQLLSRLIDNVSIVDKDTISIEI